MMNTADLRIDFLGMEFKNPVVGASGTFGFGDEFAEIYDVSALGGICSKGLTLNPKQGNKGIRIWETPMGMINSIGLQNPGVKAFVDAGAEKMRKLGPRVIANLGGSTIDEYLEGTELLNNTDIDILELNISCPNVKSGGMSFGIKSAVARDIVSRVRAVCKKPLMVKLSPNAENIADMACACAEGGADAVSLVNTFKAMAIDVRRRKPVFENIYAGLSGPAIKPIALRMVHEVASSVKIPVCGLGGIMSGFDAVEFIMAGAHIVQVGTANFVKPDICLDIIREIKDFMNAEGIKSLSEIRGVI